MEQTPILPAMSRKYNAIIVEDNEEMATYLKNLIGTRHKNIAVSAVVNNVPDAAEVIARQAPDLLFLDVELGDMKGFDLLERLRNITFPVIFTTGKSEYAIPALNAHLAYASFLVKPVLGPGLDTEVIRALAWIEQQERIAAQPHGMVVSDRRIGLPDGNDLVMVPIDDILYCVSDDPGTRVHLKTTADAKKPDPKPLFVAKGIGRFKEALEAHGFGSPSQSAVVNTRYVARAVSIGEGGDAIMTDGSRHSVSRRYKQDFFALFDRVK